MFAVPEPRSQAMRRPGRPPACCSARLNSVSGARAPLFPHGSPQLPVGNIGKFRHGPISGWVSRIPKAVREEVCPSPLTLSFTLDVDVRRSREFVGPQLCASGAFELLATVSLLLRCADFYRTNHVDNAARARHITGTGCVVPHQPQSTRIHRTEHTY